jgi:adenylate kinase
MNVSLTGTPGTGKTSVSRILLKNKINILDLNKIISEKNFIFGIDKDRNTKIIDIEILNKYIHNNFNNNKLLIIEGHLSHLLDSIDKVILLRCHPRELKERLIKRNYNKKKINENIESEILDIILCECLSKYSKRNIFEIDTTGLTIENIGNKIINIIKNNFKDKKYSIGRIDWSEEIFNLNLI